MLELPFQHSKCPDTEECVNIPHPFHRFTVRNPQDWQHEKDVRFVHTPSETQPGTQPILGRVS